MKTLSMLLVACSLHAYGQSDPCQKIGFANMQMIAQQLPETRQMEKELSSFGGQLQSQLNEKYSSYQKRAVDFESLPHNTDDAELKARRDELLRLQQEIEKFSSDAENKFLQKQEELMRPILLKIDLSINEVAAENDYSIIINTELPAGQRLLLFGNKTYDISDLVLKKLGVTVNLQQR
ncbi:OmpH family outer membrane protein [Chryseolinea sp. T2]|uniref:OmpH family outer membrane protein n=1 Tax=Chryseolinea sp. T2 TaxID=3129255 RepID=UPI00307840D4